MECFDGLSGLWKTCCPCSPSPLALFRCISTMNKFYIIMIIENSTDRDGSDPAESAVPEEIKLEYNEYNLQHSRFTRSRLSNVLP